MVFSKNTHNTQTNPKQRSQKTSSSLYTSRIGENCTVLYCNSTSYVQYKIKAKIAENVIKFVNFPCRWALYCFELYYILFRCIALYVYLLCVTRYKIVFNTTHIVCLLTVRSLYKIIANRNK